MKVGAQYDPYFSHYYDMQTAVNPAAAGKQDKINITATYAMALAGFEHAPQTAFISADMPFSALKSVHGVGVQLMSDKLGLFTHQRLSGQYAMRQKLGGGNLSVGVQAGVITEAFRGSELDLDDETDPVFSKSDVEGNSFDLGVGVFYSRKNWWAAISAQHLTSPTVTLGEQYELKVDGTYYAMGGMSFQLRNPLLKIVTSAIVRSDITTFRGDITGRLMYNYDGRNFYGGVSYSPTNSVTVLLGGQFQGVSIGYSYELFTNSISFRNGSHEIFVGYQMDVDLGKRGKNKHQTTRTL